MSDELIVWGELTTEKCCTLHEFFDPKCPTCHWAKNTYDFHDEDYHVDCDCMSCRPWTT